MVQIGPWTYALIGWYLITYIDSYSLNRTLIGSVRLCTVCVIMTNISGRHNKFRPHLRIKATITTFMTSTVLYSPNVVDKRIISTIFGTSVKLEPLYLSGDKSKQLIDRHQFTGLTTLLYPGQIDIESDMQFCITFVDSPQRLVTS